MIYLYIFTMAIVTYLIRMIPLTVFQKKIQNRFLKSFLYYVPYACLMAMTFPAVFYAADKPICAAAGVAVAIVRALFERSLVTVALFACITVFCTGLLV